MGTGLGECDDEMKPGERITEFTAIGTKCYSYRTDKGNQSTKMKGVPLNAINAYRLRYNSMLKMALGYKPKVKTAGFAFQKVGAPSRRHRLSTLLGPQSQRGVCMTRYTQQN